MATQTFFQHGRCVFKVCSYNLTRNHYGTGWLRTGLRVLARVQAQVEHSERSMFHTSVTRNTTKHVNEAIHLEEDSHGEGPFMKELRKRGLYSNTRYGHYHKYGVEEFTISKDRKNLSIQWSDGHTSEFDAIWLRHQCFCCDCKHDSNGMGKIEWHSLPIDITILSAELEGERAMLVKWGTSDGNVLHEGVIPTAFLRCYCYSNKAIEERRRQRAMKFHRDKTIPYLAYEELSASDEAVHKCLSFVNERGICLVKNVPTDMESFLKSLQLIGPIQSTMYGDTFEVFNSPNPINAAYSNAKLNFHMDLPFYEAAPGLQILHCWRFDKNVVGGRSIFLDVHEVAHKFRKECPELFNRLATYPVIFNSIHYNRPIPVHMETQKTVFSLNHYGELVSVNWHPMVTGPTELPKSDMLKFYEAYTTFYKMVSESKSLYKYKFEEGDFLIFLNRRVLHGREAFTGQGRHLVGAYIELSNFQSYAQALNNKYKNGALALRSGSHSWL